MAKPQRLQYWVQTPAQPSASSCGLGDPRPYPPLSREQVPTTMPHVSSTCYSDPAVSGHRPE